MRLEDFQKKIEKRVKKIEDVEKSDYKELKSPLPKIMIAGAIIVLFIVLTEYVPSLKSVLEVTSIINILKNWWTYLIIVIILFLFLVRKFMKRRSNIEDEELKLVEEVDKVIEKEKNLRKEEEKVKKEIEVLVDKTLKLFKLSKEKKIIEEKGEKLKAALNQPFKDDKDAKKVLKAVDELLAKLPEEEIEKFAKSDTAKLYEKLMKKYGIY